VDGCDGLSGGGDALLNVDDATHTDIHCLLAGLLPDLLLSDKHKRHAWCSRSSSDL